MNNAEQLAAAKAERAEADQMANARRAAIDAKIQAIEHGIRLEAEHDKDTKAAIKAQQVEERTELVRELEQQLEVRARERDGVLTTLKASVAPEVTAIEHLRQIGRECAEIHSVLFTATHEPRFAKSRDLLDELKFAWVTQARDRERALLRVLGTRCVRPHNDTVARLRELNTILG